MSPPVTRRRDRHTSSPLSDRERQVVELLALGRIDEDMAETIGVSLGSIRTYRKRIFAKLGATNAVQAVVIAGHLGYVDLATAGDRLLEGIYPRPPRPKEALTGRSDMP